MDENKKIVFSGAQPTGQLTIGNYIGSVKNWLALQNEYKCLFCVADLHAITVDIVPAVLRKNTLDLFSLFLATGIDPDKSTLFVQSQVPQHAELTWVLNCFTQFGEAKRMTQFKDKSAKAPQNVNVGLFDYPVLQAADILLYNADFVPVGKDQNQHIELTRNIAERFNNKFSPTFTVPQTINPKSGAKIASLTEPHFKMSKSDTSGGAVFLLESKDEIMRKFKKAVTDSGSEIVYNATEKPGISNLLTIYSVIKGNTIKQAETEFKGISYAEFKEIVGLTVVDMLSPIQKRFIEISADKENLMRLMKKGADEAQYLARKTLSKVYRKVGFLSNN